MIGFILVFLYVTRLDFLFLTENEIKIVQIKLFLQGIATATDEKIAEKRVIFSHFFWK